LAFLALCVVAAFGQSTFGSIRGTIQDGSGAVVPGASITAHSLDDNSERQVTSGSAGEFAFENLKAGHYKITAHHEGFTDAVVASATLEARQELRLPITLTISQQTTTVEVSAGGAQINTENGTVSDTLSNDNVTQLPMNSRAVSSSPLASLAIAPSVVQDSQGNIAVGGATSSQVGFSVASQRQTYARMAHFTTRILPPKESQKPRLLRSTTTPSLRRSAT
jgi:Carboxypeptidase regulatory-like domain